MNFLEALRIARENRVRITRPCFHGGFITAKNGPMELQTDDGSEPILEYLNLDDYFADDWKVFNGSEEGKLSFFEAVQAMNKGYKAKNSFLKKLTYSIENDKLLFVRDDNKDKVYETTWMNIPEMSSEWWIVRDPSKGSYNLNFLEAVEAMKQGHTVGNRYYPELRYWVRRNTFYEAGPGEKSREMSGMFALDAITAHWRVIE